jgi:hypothetical protein
VILLAIDPGSAESAYVLLDGSQIIDKGKCPNGDLLTSLHDDLAFTEASVCVIEMIASYGMPVGREVFDTCIWIGRFLEAWTVSRGLPCDLLFRRDVKLHLCGQARAKDPNIRRALIDRYGGDAAIKRDGALYKITKDIWAALALAVTYSDTRQGAS